MTKEECVSQDLSSDGVSCWGYQSCAMSSVSSTRDIDYLVHVQQHTATQSQQQCIFNVVVRVVVVTAAVLNVSDVMGLGHVRTLQLGSILKHLMGILCVQVIIYVSTVQYPTQR